MKYGLLDIQCEIIGEVNYPIKSGLRALVENEWKDDEVPEEEQEDWLSDLQQTIREDKHYIKVFARIPNIQSWMKEKGHLVEQLLSNKALKLKKRERVCHFRVKDACYTNYSSIWLWKHFYL